MHATIEEAFNELGIAEVDRRRLASEAPRLGDALAKVKDCFAKDLVREPLLPGFAETDDEVVEAQQIDHWIHLFTEEIGEDYVRRITRIGLEQRERSIHPHTHVRAYGRFTGELVGELLRRSTRPASDLADVVATVTKLVHFDMAMALRAYEATVLD